MIQQTLHGYSSGHNLLAASCELSAEEKRALLLMSDLSGSGMQTSFETYLTGYLLPGNRYYVLARTWYASEMRRPGSVWTHSLLIDLALLGQFRWLHVLTAFHKRPLQDNYEFFNKPIDTSLFLTNDFSNNTILNELETEATRKQLSQLINELYTNTNQPLVVSADNPSDFELMILAIWSQQWPRLRRNFSFCSGSLSIRYLNEETLDVQVIPISLERNLLRKYKNINFIDIDSNSVSTKILSKEQILEFFSDEVLKFMYQYGSDIDGERSKYIPLSISYHYLKRNSSKVPYNVLFKYIFSTFSSYKEANSLKKRLLKENISLNKNEAEDLLSFITNNIEFIDNDIKNYVIPYLIKVLLKTGTIDKNNFSEIFTDTLFISLSKNETGKLLNLIPIDLWISSPWLTDDLLIETIKNNHKLKESSLPWTMPLPIQKRWFNVFIMSTVDNIEMINNIEIISRAMLFANNGIWVNEIELLTGHKCVLWALDWANEHKSTLPIEWESLIPTYIETYIDWLYEQSDLSQYTITFLEKYFTPYDSRLSFIGHKYWSEICSKIIDQTYSEQSLDTVSFLIVFGLIRNLSDPQLLVSSLFQPLHDLAEHNLLTKKTWAYIERLEEDRPQRFTSVNLWDLLIGVKQYSIPYWDKCEHLRQLLVDYWILYEWKEINFLEAITKVDTFERAVQYCASFKEGKKFLIKLRNAAKSSPDKSRVKQLKIINNAI